MLWQKTGVYSEISKMKSFFLQFLVQIQYLFLQKAKQNKTKEVQNALTVSWNLSFSNPDADASNRIKNLYFTDISVYKQHKAYSLIPSGV